MKKGILLLCCLGLIACKGTQVKDFKPITVTELKIVEVEKATYRMTKMTETEKKGITKGNLRPNYAIILRELEEKRLEEQDPIIYYEINTKETISKKVKGKIKKTLIERNFKLYRYVKNKEVKWVLEEKKEVKNTISLVELRKFLGVDL